MVKSDSKHSLIEKILFLIAINYALNEQLKKVLKRCFVIQVSRKLAAQKMKCSIKNFFSKCDQIHKKLRIWSHLLKKSLMGNIFCAVNVAYYQWFRSNIDITCTIVQTLILLTLIDFYLFEVLNIYTYNQDTIIRAEKTCKKILL